jgi:L,D-transpeptidase catalytic domain/Bacterial SH3 domain
MLRWGLASVLSLAAFPSIASAQEAPVSLPSGTDDDDATGAASVPFLPVWAVTTGEASLRAQPDIADNRFGFARAGTPLQVLSRQGEWSYVFNPHTQGTAYVASGLLAPSDPPSPYVAMPAPSPVDQFSDRIVITQDSILASYPTRDPQAVLQPLQTSALENIIGTVNGDDGALWYQTADSYYVPPEGVFVPSQSASFEGRWLNATLVPVTKVIAYEGQKPVRTMLALRGIAVFPTPTGIFSILRRVPNETMDSMTLGIPHNSPYGYLVKNVLYTQYFTPDGASLHDNYWSSNFGGIGSHGCLGLSYGDSRWLWDWASIGTPVIVKPA